MMSVMVCKKCECHPLKNIYTSIPPERDINFYQLSITQFDNKSFGYSTFKTSFSEQSNSLFCSGFLHCLQSELEMLSDIENLGLMLVKTIVI